MLAASARWVRGLTMLLLLVTAALPAVAQTAGGRSIGASGLPLPRYASLAAPEVNVRTGPSTDHPIRWVYARAQLPVRIVEEFDVWRRIEDPDGETGWAHSSLLSVRRTVLVRGSGIQELRRAARGRRDRRLRRLRRGLVPDRCRRQPGLAAAQRPVGRRRYRLGAASRHRRRSGWCRCGWWHCGCGPRRRSGRSPCRAAARGGEGTGSPPRARR